MLNSFEAISYQWVYHTIYGTQLAILNDFRRQLYIKLLHNRFFKIVKEIQEASVIILKSKWFTLNYKLVQPLLPLQKS